MFQNKARKLHDRREETADIVKFLRLRLQDTGGMTRLKNSLEIFTVQYFCSAHMKPTNLNSDPCEWFCYLLMGRVPLYQIWSRQIWSWQILELVTRLLNTASFVRGKLSSLLFARRYFERFNIWKKSDQNTTFPPLSAQWLSMYSTTPLLMNGMAVETRGTSLNPLEKYLNGLCSRNSINDDVNSFTCSERYQ